MNAPLHDLRYALRQLRRNPGFTATVIVTLALAIGANTAIFSIVNALMLRSLPYSHPERIGTIFTRIRGATVTDERHHISGEQWELLRDNVPALMSAVSGIRPAGVNLEADSHVKYIQAARISAHYFDVLTIYPLIGRNFTETEDVPNGPNVAVLSYNLWRNTFGSNSHIVGESVRLKGEPYTVVGVLPDGATTPLNADVYTAI
ncbi:MAG TPA: ABC transporter permease, partial [Terriglobales bacterium]